MSSSPVIPREKLSAYQRWELHSFDGTGSGAGSGKPGANDLASQVSEATRAKHMHDRAYQAGIAEGLRLGAQKAAGDFQRLQALVAAMQQLGAANDQGIANDVLAVALEIARQMTRSSLQARPELIVPVVQEALIHVTPPVRQAVIALNPDDAILVREHLHEQLAAGGWSIVEDAHVIRGGCALHTAGSHVDATTPGRWRSLAAALGQASEWLE